MARLTWLIDAGQDVRLGCRHLTRSIRFAAAAVLILSNGIGLAIALFTVADTVLRWPLPVLAEDRVVVVWGEAAGSMRTIPLTPRHFERYRHEARAFDDVAGTVGIESWAQAVRDGDISFRANLSPVTGNFFRMLGAEAVLGRMLRPDDDRSGAEPVAVISHSMWRTRFAGNPAVLGRRIALQSSRLFTVVGVAPPGLEYPAGTEIWIPFAMFDVPEVTPIGRLESGVSAADAATEIRASFEREPAGGGWMGLGGSATPLRSLIVGDAGPPLLLLTVAAVLLLLTACLNVSSLLLVRGATRRHEMAVRRALGAGRGRLIRQLVVETSPIALMAGILGAWLSAQLIHVFVALAPATVPRLEEVRLQGSPPAIAVLLACAVVLGCGIVPALWLSSSVGSALRASPRGSTATRRGLSIQKALVVLQVSLAVIVLFAAGLLGRTLQQLQQIDTGFAAGNVAILELSWPEKKFGTPSRGVAFYDGLMSRLQALPDVASAAPVNVVPFTGAAGGWDGTFVAEGRPEKAPVLNLAVVGAGYLETLGIGLRSGRAFTGADLESGPRVAIVSERAARLLWPGEDALGKRLRFGDRAADWRTVVGVAQETRYRAIREPAPTVYLPARQFPEVMPLITTVAVRTKGSPAAAFASIREAVRQADQDVLVLDLSALSDLVSRQFATPRLNAALVAVFGAGAVLMATAGLYAVLAGFVRERRRELAIRHAIGATPGRLRAIVLGQALGMCAGGVALGLAVSLGTARLLAVVLYGVAAYDPRTVSGVVALLTAVTLAAAYIPARQATLADAMELLRQE